VNLGGDHNLVTLCELAQQLADDLFAGTGGVDIGGVEGGDAGLERLPDDGFMQHPRRNLQGESSYDAENVPLVHAWVLTSLLNNLFGGQSDRALDAARQAFKGGADGFPVEALVAALESTGKRPQFDEVALQDFLAITYGNRDCFLALSLLYDAANWGHTPFQQDHIVPQSLFQKKHFEELGFAEERRTKYLELRDLIGNLELLTESENQQKSAQEFEPWLATRSDDFRQTHLIPEDDALLDFDHFEEFVAARERLITNRLLSLFGGQAPMGVE
jgi:hypothetical protein